MIALLCEANTAVNQARAHGRGALAEAQVENIRARSATVLSASNVRNQRRPGKFVSRGRVKQSPAQNRIVRLRDHRDCVLLDFSDLRVPFENNPMSIRAERDMRMPTLKRNVSSCIRTPDGPEHFAISRSSLSTLRKPFAKIFRALVLGFQDSPPMPQLL